MKKRKCIMKNMETGAENKNQQTAIYVMTHKAFTPPPDPLYIPLHVGRAAALSYSRDEKSSPLSFCVGDNTGDHISEKNCYYSELTGLYWIWKNVHTYKYVGTCHYRRYLLNEQEKIFTEAEYLKLLKDYDLITTKRVVLNNSYHYGFATNHNIHALDMTGEVIKELYPEYYDTFVQLENGTETYFGNMIVTSKKWFDTYCEWLFHIFFEVQKRICLENGEDDYHKRVFGFISEFLLLVWVRVNHLKVYECKVGMLGEKAETREMKEQLAGYFFSMDAKTYFAEMLKKRPDVLMEASDITGELKLSMQIIATMDQELQRTGHCYLRKENRFRELITLFTRLNAVIRAYLSGQVTEEDRRFLIEQSVSETAVKVGVFILPISAEQKKKLETEILKDLNA